MKNRKKRNYITLIILVAIVAFFYLWTLFKANILGAVRKEKFVFLKKNDKMLVGDKAYVVISSKQMKETLEAFGHNEKISKKILTI